jgi:hypothetical protein
MKPSAVHNTTKGGPPSPHQARSGATIWLFAQ